IMRLNSCQILRTRAVQRNSENHPKRISPCGRRVSTFVSTIFAGCYHDRDDDWGYHRYSRDYSYDRDRYDRDRYYNRDPYYDRDAYYDRDWRRDRYDRWNDYRDRDDSYRSESRRPAQKRL
ncbi:MAG TPA: hypothetical protein VK355_13065, partial [Candidatus Binatia bacterium]|nr:hypothetical protein [Candidatus Binatia bacterium]